MKKKSLLIVDVQKDFCPGGALPVPKGDEVVEPLNKMIEFAEKEKWLIIASRDWHPRITTHFKEYGGLWPAHCVKNTEGAKFHPLLKIDGTLIISKGMGRSEDAYSAFDGKTDDGKVLENILKEYGIEEIYIGGLATDYCVKATVIDALKNGFKTYLLLDACRAVNWSSDDEKKAIEEMKAAGAIITTTEESFNAEK